MRGNRTIGIAREVFSKWERRAPLTPAHVEALTRDHGVSVLVQPCGKRAFPDAEFARAGATLTDDLSPACAVLGVKQPAVEALLPGRTHLFFSHTIKGQPENMALLAA